MVLRLNKLVCYPLLKLRIVRSISKPVGARNELHHNKYLSEAMESFSPYYPEQIIDSLMEVQNLASVSDLGLAFDWMQHIEASIWDKEEGYRVSYAQYGFIEIYDLGQSDKCWVYGNQQGEYEFMNNLEYSHYDGSFNLYPNSYYRNYLDYLQLLLAKICLDKEYKNQVFDYASDEELVSYVTNHRMNRVLDEQTESALTNIREFNIAHDCEIGHNRTQRRRYTESHYLVADEMFYQIRDVRRRLGDYSGNIFIYYGYKI